MTRKFWLDFETYSEVDVKKVGSYAYAAHPSTEALCMAYAYDDSPIQLWLPGQPFPDTFGYHYVAHNIEFERELLWQLFGIDTAIEDWEDVAAIARFQSLPGGLDDLCKFFGYSKHSAGHKAMLKLCKPRKPTKHNSATRWTPETAPNDFQNLYAYCRWDVEIMRKNYNRLRSMTAEERQIWALTIRMNERGLPIDAKYIPKINKVIDAAAANIQQKVTTITGGIKTSQPVALAKWLEVPNLQKHNVEKWLREWPDSPKKEVLQARYDIEKTSLRKVAAMERMLMEDDTVRGCMVYAGADRTRRWSGSGIQPQNLPRGIAGDKLDAAFAELDKSFPQFEDPHDIISNMLKGLIIPPNGRPWIIADYSQIEVRVLAWLAGAVDLLGALSRGEDPYINLAHVIYNLPKDQIAKDSNERFYAKQLILGCGYGLGHKKFHADLRDKYNAYLPLEECHRLVNLYRRFNPEIPKFWYEVEECFKIAICGDTVAYKGLIFSPDSGLYFNAEDSVSIQLPSGGTLYYNRVSIDSDGCIRYFGRNQYTTKLEQVQTYGGKITENITQAIARDIMAQAMLRIEANGFPIHLTVHDEIMAQLVKSAQLFVQLMTQRPTWGQGIPLAVEYKIARRYQK